MVPIYSDKLIYRVAPLYFQECYVSVCALWVVLSGRCRFHARRGSESSLLTQNGIRSYL